MVFESLSFFFLLLNSGGRCGACRLLGSDELGIVDEAVAILVVGVHDRVDHVAQLVVLEDLGLGNGLPGLGVVVGLV